MSKSEEAWPTGHDGEARGEESYESRERDCLNHLEEGYGKDVWRNCQMRSLLKRVFAAVRRNSEAEKVELDDHYRRLYSAMDLVEELREALNEGQREMPPEGVIWQRPNLLYLDDAPKSWFGDSPVSEERLDWVLANYLQSPWMHCAAMETYLLQGYLFHCFLSAKEELLSGRALGMANWAYVFSGGSTWKMMCWRAGFDLAKFLLRWVLPPAAVALVYFYGPREWAFWLVWPVGTWLVFSLVTLPLRLLRARRLEKKAERFASSLLVIGRLYDLSVAQLFSIKEMERLALRLEEMEGHLPVGFNALLATISGRGDDVFISAGD